MSRILLFLILFAMHSRAQSDSPTDVAATHGAKTMNKTFDGRPWNISSGNLSVSFIQHSPIGAFPETNFMEAPPSVESQFRARELGLMANEDYIAWGAVEREKGQWNWQQHDAMEHTLHEAGLKYVVYNWAHFPPAWLRDQQEKRTLMRCLEHRQEANYLSIFDPRTIEWYDHYYKNLAKHFGERIDDVYACILGPYGEGNYPLEVTAYINMGHCHEGYWCGDEFALKAFRAAMKRKYSRVQKLNRAWRMDYRSFDAVCFPAEISEKGFKPSPETFSTADEKRRWLDFITWYHQAIVDFAGESAEAALKYFPARKVRMKPGGNYGSVNPLPWGTYCPAYGKMAGRHGIVLQPADCQGAIFGDKWMGTAYQFYGVTECTEPAGNLIPKAFVQRMFSDASSGAAQLFTYEFEQHVTNIQKYVHLFTGRSGDTEIALYCPTTLYRLGRNLHATIEASYSLRDLCEFDVLDELLITDGALTTKRYKVLVLFQSDTIDQPTLKKFSAFLRSGGKIIMAGNHPIQDVEGDLWRDVAKITCIAPLSEKQAWPGEMLPHLAGRKGVDGKLDGLWTCRRGEQVFAFNANDKAAHAEMDGRSVEIAAHTIWFNDARSDAMEAPSKNKTRRTQKL